MAVAVTEIQDQVRAFIIQTFPAAQGRSLHDDDPLLGGNIVDSVGILKLITYVESEFEITIEDEDISPEHFQSIGCLSALVRSKLDLPTSA